ncbi:MAG TPA: plasmid stabilization protein [Desulfovibrio sp.]|nr:plasmid stabilization protein [Desulfovibrio sp.]
MTYHVVFSPEAEKQILNLYRYVAETESSEVATRFTNSIIEFCEGLKTFPLRGIQRDDIRKDLRVIHFKKRTSIAYAVFEERIAILGIFYGGQNYEEKLTKQ